MSGSFSSLNRVSVRWFITAAVLLIIYTFYFSQIRPQSFFFSNHHSSSVHTQASPESRVLEALCSETKWRDGLWLHCHSFCGENKTSVCSGLNNARNRMQTCLRLAIDAGSGLILPSVMARTEENLRIDGGSAVCADAFWDMEYLGESLQEQCPQLKIRYCDNRTGIDNILEAPFRAHTTEPHLNGSFHELVDSIIEEGNVTSTNDFSPVAVNFGDSYLGWNYTGAGELGTIRKALFKALRFNRSLLEISTKILQSPELRNGFIAIHFRGENDWPWFFGTADDQMRLYTSELENIQSLGSNEPKTIYVSCGDPGAIQRFREKLSPLGYTVYDKWTLLAGQPEMLEMIDGLFFDQKGILEYEVMVNAKFWLGIVTSTLSSLVAYARSVEDEDDFFETYIFPGSVRTEKPLERWYSDSPSMKGNNFTKLMVLTGPDVMASFP